MPDIAYETASQLTAPASACFVPQCVASVGDECHSPDRRTPFEFDPCFFEHWSSSSSSDDEASRRTTQSYARRARRLITHQARDAGKSEQEAQSALSDVQAIRTAQQYERARRRVPGYQSPAVDVRSIGHMPVSPKTRRAVLNARQRIESFVPPPVQYPGRDLNEVSDDEEQFQAWANSARLDMLRYLNTRVSPILECAERQQLLVDLAVAKFRMEQRQTGYFEYDSDVEAVEADHPPDASDKVFGKYWTGRSRKTNDDRIHNRKWRHILPGSRSIIGSLYATRIGVWLWHGATEEDIEFIEQQL